jgi:copper homeostasis protein
MVEVEVVAFSLESCKEAVKGGAKRIELCSNMYEGGTTPSAGLVEEAIKLKPVEIHVMIRPRGGDFCYNEEEFKLMKREIELVREMGAHGVVFGVLTPEGTIDLARNATLIAAAGKMETTIHRAFDMAADAFAALESVIQLGFTRILTSAQQNSVADGIPLLSELVEKANKRIQVMAGSGVNETNALALAKTGINALHLSGKAKRESAMSYRRTGIYMGGLTQINEYEITYTDHKKVKAVVDIITELEMHGKASKIR